MCHLRLRLRIFLFHRKVMFCSQDVKVFVFLTISWFTKSVLSWWVLLHEPGCIFEYIFEPQPQVTKCGQLRDNKQEQFSEIFWTIWSTGAMLLVLFNLATCSNYPITNYVRIPMFHFFFFFFFFFFWKGE